MQKHNIITISANSRLFPDSLKPLHQQVESLLCIGDTSLLSRHPALGIVGARNMTPYGEEVTTDLTRATGRAGATIVSGLAFGIDSVAHHTAIEVKAPTIAVLPSLLPTIYPSSNYALAEKIISSGGLLVSEGSIRQRPAPYDFIRRNRIIAALSDVILVTEAAAKSGSRHTVDFAFDLGKDICAVPGNINSPLSAGTNAYINEAMAYIVTEPADILCKLGINENFIKPQFTSKIFGENAILTALNNQKLSDSGLLEATKLTVQQLNVHLTMLEVNGAIERSPSGAWRLAT